MTVQALSDPSQLSQVVERTLRIPETAKRFEVSTDEAQAEYYVPAEVLADLLDLGLAARGEGDHRRFDPLDLENVALDLRLPTPQRRAMDWWSRSLLAEPRDGEVVYSVNANAKCPEPGHPGDCQFEIDPLLAAACRPDSLRTKPAGAAFDIVITHRNLRFGGRYTELIERLAALHFHILPDAVQADLGFLRETGLANCGLATRYAQVLGEELGLPVRPSCGYFVTAPFMTGHSWPEFQWEGDWVAADPFILTAISRWGVAGGEHWPADRSTAPLTWRVYVSDEQAPSFQDYQPVLHSGRPAPTTLMARERRG